MRWEGEGREPFSPDAITTLGNNKSASLLFLSFAKVSNTKDVLNRQTSVSPPSHLTNGVVGRTCHPPEPRF